MAVLQSALALVVDAALGVWLGSIVFFSFVAAPRIFDVLGSDRAGPVVNAIFPTYYLFGLALGLVALAGGVVAAFTGAATALPWVFLPVVGAGVVTNAYARFVLIPKMEAAGDDAFQTYHRQSVQLNGLTMLAIAVGLVVSHL